MRFKTGRDLILGGYIASFAPVLVDWRASVLSDASPFVVLRNVNYGGNPLEGSVVLQPVQVPLDGIAFAELTLVPFGLGGACSALQHVQLRFVFEPDNQPRLLNLSRAETGTDASVPDLILSWESWRAKGTEPGFGKSLDIAAYSLTQRVFAGPQLFLEDTVCGRQWYGHRLRLPGDCAGLAELFLVGLALGDGAARSTISGLLQQSESEWLSHAPRDEAGKERLLSEWRELQQQLREAAIPEGHSIRMPNGADDYRTLVRSCAALTRYTVLAAAARLLERGFDDDRLRERLLKFEIPSPEPWMSEFAHVDLGGVFLRAPLTVSYVLRCPEPIPRKIPVELADAGLLESRNGEPRSTRYCHGELEPYCWESARFLD